MIKYITSLDLAVSTNGNSGPYSSGAVYWDGNAQKFKVIDASGGAQDMYGASVNIELNAQFHEIQSWVLKKQAEERELEKLCKEYPNLAEAKKEFDMLYKLVKEYK